MKKTTDKNIEIEKMVLGALIVDSQAMAENHSLLNVNLFTTPEHQNIYKTIEEVWRRSYTVDLILLTARLTEKKIEAYTTYCIELTKIVSSSANIAFHIHLLIQNYIRRNFIENFSSLVEKTMLSSLNIVNKVLGGWQKSNLSIVAGRPNMGKSAFFSQEIIRIAEQGYSVGVFSLNISDIKLITNFLSNLSGLSNTDITGEALKYILADLFSNLSKNLERMKIYIDSTSSISIDNLIKGAKKWKLECNIDVLFIDNLQLICYNKAPNREQEVSFIVRSLKDLAKELDIPIIVLSQLSRNVEQRIDKRPILSDLKDSGTIEEVADDVLFLYRPEHYGKENWGVEYSFESSKNQVEIIVAKNPYREKLSERYSIDMKISRIIDLLEEDRSYSSWGRKDKIENQEDIPY